MSHSLIFKENFIAVIGVLLCLYFSYHAISGERSLFRLMSLNKEIVLSDANADNVFSERQIVLAKVLQMRPGSINIDLLEEQARLVLGYRHVNDMVILSN